jgi:flagellar L-ring protein precursor FlgH
MEPLNLFIKRNILKQRSHKNKESKMEKKVIWTITTIVICLLILTSYGSADSIWAKRDKNAKALYADDTARQVGDLLTIIISEASKVDNKVNRELKKSTQESSNFNGELGIVTPEHNLFPRIPGFTMASDSDNKLSGQADYKDERKMEDRITVVVQDVQPNGNLVIVGSRQRDIAHDKQTITVSGIVRPTDIAFDNTVRSEQIGNFHMVNKTEGLSDTYNKPGWLQTIFNFLWPW